ncbi:MAG: DUF547 domain-containing protein [Myxococcota bacterium]
MRVRVLPLILAILNWMAAPVPAQAQTSVEAREAYAGLLKRHVSEGLVDYAALAKDENLEVVIDALAKASVPQEKEARIAFYIDAYNALVLHAVVKHGRPRSVLDVKGFFDGLTHTVAGRKLTLDQLEKQVINPFAKDPRTHFVLVCGAVGCPILESKPFSGTPLDARMEAATRRYLQNPRGAQVQEGKLALSKIFDWYAADFGGADKVRSFVEAHLPKAERARLGETYELAFIDYNWTLNQR